MLRDAGHVTAAERVSDISCNMCPGFSLLLPGTKAHKRCPAVAAVWM